MSSEISEVVAGQVNERFLEVPTNSTYFADLATLNAAQSGAQNPFDAVVREVVDLRAAAGNMSAFDSRYVPLASDRIFLGTNSWGVMTGNPVVGTLGNATNAQQRTTAMLLDGTSNEGIITSFVMPTAWASASFHIWWSNAGAGSGDIYWTINALNMADAATSDAFGSTIYNGAVTAPAQYVVKRTSGTGTLTATAGQLVRLNIIRLPGDPGDTLTNDIGVIAVEVVRAS